MSVTGTLLFAAPVQPVAAEPATGRPSAEALAELRGSGALGAVIPTEYGGRGGGAELANQVVADLARRDPSLAIVLFQHLAVSARLTQWGTAAQRAAVLPELASGRWLAASAWSETGAGANKKRLSTVAAPDGSGGWLLSGVKSFVTGAGIADVYLVLAQTEPADPAAADTETLYGSAGQTLFLVPADAPGLSVGTHLDLDGMRTSATGSVRLDGCPVGADAVVGAVGAAPSVIASVRESGATLAAVSLGIGEAVRDVVRAHVTRVGAAAPQASRHRLVEIESRIEAVRAVVERAGRRDSDDPGTTVLHSKLFASAEVEEVCALAQQLVGSAGYVRSHPLNALARDARAVALMGPTNELCRELVSASWRS
jgi:alkylation response protein AidB-like acyl-CoA dehydrogenase